MKKNLLKKLNIKAILLIIAILILVLTIYYFAKMTGLVVSQVSYCKDSDEGKDYWQKGQVSGEDYSMANSSQQIKFLEEDYCMDDNTLIEYYCAEDQSKMNSYMQKEKFNCPNQCIDGYCLR